MKIFLTGGSGFIGGEVVKKLVERGHTVKALVRSERAAETVCSLGAEPYFGDITERETLPEGMRGSEVVFHIAAWYKYGQRDQSPAVAINIDGTRNVLSLAYELGIPKIIYTSTIAVFGDTQGKLVDESFRYSGPFLTEYDRTKWVAHYEVAERLIERGAPITIVMPGGVYGPGDSSIIGNLIRLFLRGLLPVIPSPGMVFTLAHVGDIAEGHLLALEKGRAGECYILAGPAMSTSDLVGLCASLTGQAGPLFHLPGKWLRFLTPLVKAVTSFISLPSVFSPEAFEMMEATYLGRSDKARSELGWTTRPLLDGLGETLDWFTRSETAAPVLHTRSRQIAFFSLLAGMVVLGGWLFERRSKK